MSLLGGPWGQGALGSALGSGSLLPKCAEKPRARREVVGNLQGWAALSWLLPPGRRCVHAA